MARSRISLRRDYERAFRDFYDENYYEIIEMEMVVDMINYGVQVGVYNA